MRGAPQSGFSRLSRRIRSWTFFGTAGRPGWPRPTFQVHNRRKLLRCQAMTVFGLTMIRADRQPLHTELSHTHRSRSAGASLGRFTERWRTPNWCRSARFSSWSTARDLKVADTAAANT